MFHLNQPNIERKNWVWTTSRLLEMCIVPHVETKSVFIFQPTKRLVFTTVKSAKPSATFWMFLLRTKNRQLCCLAVTVHIVYTNRDYEKEGPSPFLKKFLRQSQLSTSAPEPKKVKNESKYGKNVSVSYWLLIWATYSFSNPFILFQSTVNRSNLFSELTQNHHDLLNLRRRNPVDSRFWTRLSYYCSKWSWAKYNNQLTRKTPSSLAIALVSKTRLFEQSSSANSNYSQPIRNNWNERRSALQCVGSRLGH